MAAVLVRQSGKQEASGVTPFGKAFSFAVLPAVGNIIIVSVWGWGGTIDPGFTCADNQGNTYTSRISQVNGTSHEEVRIFSALVNTSAGTFTVTVTNNGNDPGSASIVFNAQEWSGLSSAVPDKTTSSTGNSTAPSTGTTATTTQGDEVLIGACVINATQTSWTANAAGSTPASGWTQEINEIDSATFQAGAQVDRIVTATGGYVHVWTATTSDVWSGVIATFKVAVVSGGGVQSILLSPIIAA